MIRIFFLLLCCNSLFLTKSFAITQNGNMGSSSTANIDASFSVENIAKISGLNDVTINNIDPSNGSLPLNVVQPNPVCLYSSTDSVNVTASLSGSGSQSIDVNMNTAKLTNNLGDFIDFRLKLGGQDLFVNTSPVFTASSLSLTCNDNKGNYPISITLINTKVRADTYRAVVNLTITPS